MKNKNLIIEANNLVKRYKQLTALDHFSLEVKQGDVLGLLGPNGSGKSTAINCILSLLTFDKGEVFLFGEKMSPQNYKVKQRIGIVPQDVAVFEELTVYENIDYFCGLYVKDKKQRKQYIEEAIEIVQLHDFIKFYPNKLSGGLLRRLNIACGIAHKPELIFFDEPTVAVDPQSRNNILESIKQLNNNGATIVYTSHYMEEIEQICSTIVIMDHGQSLASGTNDELKKMIQVEEKINVDLPICPESFLAQIRKIKGILLAEYDGTQLHVDALEGHNVLLHILQLVEENSLIHGNYYNVQPTLNDVFLEITGKQLRD